MIRVDNMDTLNERQIQEIELIKNAHFLTIKQLAQSLRVSEMTIRRDIPLLVERKLISQVFGGVVSAGTHDDERKYVIEDEISKNKNLKLKIAQKAVTLIQPNDVIFFDSGTTIQLLTEQIPQDFFCTAISSSFNALCVLAKLENSTVITPGGVFSHKPGVFYDLESIRAIRRYRANIAFMGATGYELEMGPTCAYIEDAPLKQAMIESSKTKVLLIDSSKFGIVSTCSFARISDFTVVITDSGIPPEYAEQLRANKVELITV